jgi:hypothetical protein
VASFAWNGTLAGEGNASVTIVVVDGEGAVGWETVPVPLVPEFRASAQASVTPDGAGRAFWLNLSMSGGLPPFDLTVASSAGEGWNRSFASDGTYSLLLPTNDSGSVSLDVVLRDRLGAEWTDALSFVIQSTAPPPNGTSPSPPPTQNPSNGTAGGPPSGDLTSLLALLVVGGTAAVAVALLRRRGHRPTREAGPAVDPVRVLRRILEPADGADRSTVELMAEEAGVPPEVARSTIDRLVVEGTIRSESGPDGEEVLAWSEPDPSSLAGGRLP